MVEDARSRKISNLIWRNALLFALVLQTGHWNVLQAGPKGGQQTVHQRGPWQVTHSSSNDARHQRELDEGFQQFLADARDVRNPRWRVPKRITNEAFAASPTQWTSYALGNQATYSVQLGAVTLRFGGAKVRMVDGSFLNNKGSSAVQVPSNRLVATSGWATDVALPRPTIEPFNYNVSVGYSAAYLKGYLTRESVMVNYQRSLPTSQCPHKTAWYVYRYQYHAPDGTIIQFFERPAETSRRSDWASTCGSTPVTGVEPAFYWSEDGNALLDTTSKCTPVIRWADGSVEEFDNGIAPSNPYQDTDIMSPPYTPPCTAADLDRDLRLIDRNGNITRFRSTTTSQTMTDSRDRKTVLTFDFAPSGLKRLLSVQTPSIGNAPPLVYTIAWRTLDISFAQIWPDIQCRQDGTGFAYTCPPSKVDLVDSITIPDGRSYRFYYGAWGNLEYVFEPGGAVRQYVYGGVSNTSFANAAVALNNRVESCSPDSVPGCRLWSAREVNMQARGMIAERVWPDGCGGSTPAQCNASFQETKYDQVLTKLGSSDCTFDEVGAAKTGPAGCSQVWEIITRPDGAVTKSGKAVRAIPTGKPSDSFNPSLPFDPHGWTIGNEVWSGSTLVSADYQGDKNTGELFYDYDTVKTLFTTLATTGNARESKRISFRDGLYTTANSVYGDTIDIDPDPVNVEMRNTGNPTSVCQFAGWVTGAGCSPPGATPLTRMDATYKNYFSGGLAGTNLLGLLASKRLYGADGTAFSSTSLTESIYGYDELAVDASGLPASVLDSSLGLAAGSPRGNPTSLQQRVSSGRYITAQTKFFDTGAIQWQKDPKGRKVTYQPTFDVCSSVSTLTTTVTDPLGGVTTLKVDCVSGNPLRTIDENGESAFTQYDFLGRPVEVAGPGDVLTALSTGGPQPFTRDADAPTGAGTVAGQAAVTSWKEYLALGVIGQQREVAHVRDGSTGGLYTKTFFDGLNRPVQTRVKTDPARSNNLAELVLTTVYDAMGRTPRTYTPCFAGASDMQTANCGKVVSTTTFDALGRALTVALPGNRNITNTYGQDGTRWLTTTVNARGYTTKTYTNLLGQVVQVDQQSARCGGFCTTTSKYDAADRLLTLKDHLQNAIEQRYDDLGRRTSLVDPDMGSWSYEYDDNSNLIKQTDAKGQVITFDYDALNRLTWKNLPPLGTTPGAEDVTYSYDGDGPAPPADTQPNASDFVTQSVPSAMSAGQTTEVTVTMRNTGLKPWTAAEQYRLGSQNPQDNSLWRDGRVELPSAVAPGDAVTFRFNITAPATAGTYAFQWRMLREGVEWFGAFAPTVMITVSPANNPVPTLSSISPASVDAGSPDFTLTVNGKAFVPASVVRFNGSDRATTFVSSTQLTARILSADTQAPSTVITVFNPAPGGGTSAPTSLAITLPPNPVPALGSIGPSSVQAGDAGFTLTVNGGSFVSGSVVRFNGSNRATTFVSASQVTAQIASTDIQSAGSYAITVFNPAPGGGTSGSVSLTVTAAPNPVPAVTSISPSSVQAGGAGFTLTVNGGGFVSGSVVRFNGSNRTTTFVSTSQLAAQITSTDIQSTGSYAITVFNPTPGGGTSGSVSLTVTAAPNPVPALTSISPSSVQAGGAAFTLTVNGSSFVSSSVVRFNGSNRTTTFVSASQLTAQITSADIQSAGSIPITVFNPTPGGGTSGSVSLTVTAAPNPVPALTSISPSSVQAGGAGFTLTVNGSSFVSGSVVRFNGSNRTTTFVSASQLTAQITSADIQATGSIPITVFNPTPGGGTSGSVSLTVTAAPNPVPALTSISPSSVQAGGAGFTLTVNGSSFVAGAVVRFNGSNRTTTFVSASQLTAQITSADIQATGSIPITVFNPTPGGGTSGSVSLTVTTPPNPVPAITNTSPSSISAGSAAFTLTVNGSNLVSGAVVRVNNSDRPTTFVSSTRVTAQISAADVQSAGALSITALNPGTAASAGAALNVFAIKSIYKASIDFSSVQGQNGWSYLDANGTPLSWDAANNWWSGNFALLWGAGGHPSNNVDAMRQWRAPAPGTIRITGTASDGDGGGGDGVVVSIRKGATVLWQQTIANGNTTGLSYDLTTTVVAGDAINFVINRNAESTYDSTNFDPTITLSPTYKASVDFSNTQGRNNWNYLDSNGTSMSFDAANGWWNGGQQYLLLWSSGGHPQDTDAVRQWRTPGPGTIRITGKAFDENATCGDGVAVSIKKGAAVLWQQTIANGDATGFSFDLTTAVAAGDAINFVINKRADWGCDSTNFDPSISFTPAVKASSDFSTLQGQNNWSYLDSNGTAMSFDGVNNQWKGGEQFLSLWSAGGHPGNTVDSVRQWRAPAPGSIRITGTASDNNPGGGDGVVVSIKKGTSLLWQQTIQNADATGFSYDLTTPVIAGDAISFVINKRGDWNFDGTNFDPTISYSAAAPAPAVSAVSPVSGTTAGGTAVTITGTGFVSGASVTIGGTSATVNAVSATSITATTPSHAAGAVDVVVRNVDTQTGTLTNGFTYVAPVDTTPPIVTISSPLSGSIVASTTTVSANASDNVGVAGVQFRLDGANLGAEDTTSPYSTSWNTAAVSNGSHVLSAVARDAAGNTTTSSNVTVTVSNTAPAPAVSAISPVSGTTAGGTAVTITGTAFVSGATVTIGGTAATGVNVASATSITAITPAHAAGAASVVVRNPDNQTGTLTNGFTYNAPGGGSTPIGYWKFDEGSGTTAADSSGNGAAGTLINSPVWQLGRLNGALSFNGTNYVSIPNQPSWNVASGKYTVAFWVKVNEIADFHGAVAIGKWGTGALEITTTAQQWFYTIRTSGGPNNWPCDGSSGPLGYLAAVDNTFHHVAVVLDAPASRCYFYSDGALVATDQYVDGVTSFGTQNLNIGGFSDANQLKSVIDDVRLYNTALTQAEVQALASGAP